MKGRFKELVEAIRDVCPRLLIAADRVAAGETFCTGEIHEHVESLASLLYVCGHRPSAWKDGYDAGYVDACEAVVKHAREKALDEIGVELDDRYHEGYQDGQSDGYQDGLDEANDS